MSRGVTLALLVSLLIGACGSPVGHETGRLPLDSPPNPGEIPAHDGLNPILRDQVAASTFRVVGIACGRASEGSGFAVTDTLVATNAHVVVGIDAPELELPSGERVLTTPVAFDADRDLALLRVEGATLSPLPLGTADDNTIGALFGWEAGPEADPTPFRIDRPVTVRIEAVGSDERIERRSWLLAARVEQGDSGAALVDGEGVVVGIAYATTTRGAGVAYAIRASELVDLIAEGFDSTLTIPDC
ncbi:MAG: trypsin-like peptidase domain-containing protein [Acidimicrobiaceae bacterium]|jgi:S1-C subfamily serine protease|nr:trypsin-like peptidase domain-containing protein [Acidimicrobiaceae bacterium]MBT5580173.1 trypsin-like peptidase domain-containing protein [Acidimicrobiaceae bacterium]MBT5850764.1 trypsin-like peptidase domain-containing protein [Acidimicrobiaceae bacterium]